MSRRGSAFLAAVALILAGGALARGIETAGGAVEVEEVRFPGPDGIFQHGRLYIPEGVTSEQPAPGILAIHGYINSSETQSGFAIEFARRGWVVLAVDQTGHGYSDPPVAANGYGGPPALAFLRSLDFVDGENIGMEGHSMGGWASMAAAATLPDAYRAIVLEGSSPGIGPAANASDRAPKNVAVVFSRYDEFASLMWGVPVAGDVSRSERLRAFFGTDEPVVPGRVYGSIPEGTARVLHQPPVTHPGDHLSRAAIGHAIDWFQATLEGGNGRPASDQIWYWKELGTLVALGGMVLLLLPVASLLLDTAFFAELKGDPAPARGARGGAWWGAALVFVVLPAATLFPFKGLFDAWRMEASVWLPQNVTTQIVLWACLLGAISLGLFLAWHRTTNRSGAAADAYGLTRQGRIGWRRVGKSFLLALLVVGAGYGSLVLTDYFFQTDYRFWVFGVKLLSPLQLRIALPYLLPFTAFFLVLGLVLHGQLRVPGRTETRETVRNVGLLVTGFVGLLLFQYLPLLAGATLAVASEPLWTIIAFQFLPIMTIVALVSTYLFRRTGQIYAGAFASGLLVTWIVVASQATHHPF